MKQVIIKKDKSGSSIISLKTKMSCSFLVYMFKQLSFYSRWVNIDFFPKSLLCLSKKINTINTFYVVNSYLYVFNKQY